MTTGPILVVIADDELRKVVRWIIEEMDLVVTVAPTWRAAFRQSMGRPACVVVDLDDELTRTVGASVLRKGWGGRVPLIILAHHPDVALQAAAMGAFAGVRKPLNADALMDAVRQAISL